MSIITPAGNKNVKWVPEDKKMTKTASTGETVDQEIDYHEALYQAAKSVVAKEEKVEKEEDDADEKQKKQEKEAMGSMCDEDAVVLDVEEVNELPVPAEGVVEDVVEEVAEEVGEEAAGEVEEKAAVDTVEVAVEKVEEAVADLKDAVECAEDTVEEEAAVEKVEVEVEVPEDKEDEGLIVESEPEMVASASTSEEFCKFAMLSPQNREKIRQYWKNALKYPSDYVDLMTKDYEK